MKGSSIHWISCGRPLSEPIGWQVKFCLVAECQLVLLDKREVHAHKDILNDFKKECFVNPFDYDLAFNGTL